MFTLLLVFSSVARFFYCFFFFFFFFGSRYGYDITFVYYYCSRYLKNYMVFQSVSFGFLFQHLCSCIHAKIVQYRNRNIRQFLNHHRVSNQDNIIILEVRDPEKNLRYFNLFYRNQIPVLRD